MTEARTERRSPGRVPPHNLRAEESVLGAMLLSREAIAEVVENLDPDHFYKPAHGHVYDAVMGLYGAGQPVDAVTVAEELQRAGLLEEIGGPTLLLDLQANTPAISNAGHYAKIVEEHAMLRRLITVSNEIAETAYGVPDDVVKAIDDAEARMFEVAQRRVTNSTAEIKDLLSANLDRLEMLYERGESITGVSTGYLDLDELLSGLQPNAMYVIGARPAMGKALALDTPLVTPDGWTTMDAVQVGDRVFDEGGRPTTVTYTSPVFRDHDCYQVQFDDGSVIVADGDHRWVTWDHRARPGTRTTRELAEAQRGRPAPSARYRIPVAKPLDCPEAADLPVDPHLVGFRLGAGESGRTEVSLAGPDTAPGSGADEGSGTIPGPYRRSSFKQRLALLQGLMDAAGSVVDEGRRPGGLPAGDREPGASRCRLTVPTGTLARQARELALSLGYKAFPVTSCRSDTDVAAWSFDFFALDPVFDRSVAGRRQRVVDEPGSPTRWRTIIDVRPVPSVPTRCISVDGPSHLYLAGREMIPTHNTAFSLGMAANAAMKDQKPVLIFNLEMSQLELSQRILCSEALVDSSRIRTGKIGESEWTRISHAVGRLAEAPIYIDDNPHTSVMEIRAKARRLKSRVGELGMVVVDYIQLMTGRSNAESRQVEVSEISRGLKILARELEAPVVALAQLNRQLEQRVDKRPMLSDLRESGCLPADTRLLLADGTERTLGDLLAGRETPEVWAVDDRHRLTGRRLLKTFPSGRKMVYRLSLASGRTVDATGCHRFLTDDGWTPLADLDAGRLVATPRVVPEPVQPDHWPDDEVVLLAQFLGGGPMVEPGAWLERLGVEAGPPHQQTIPEAVHRLSTKQVALFLHHLWSAGGSVTSSRSGQRPRVSCRYTTASRPVALGVQRLLLRFEVRSTVSTPGEGGGGNHHVDVQGRRDLLRFLTEVTSVRRSGPEVRRAIELLDQDIRSPGEEVDDARSDVHWDRVSSIEPVGVKPVFDATIDEVHNFVANGAVAHNSLEQDADVVMFLYRDEVYDDQSPDKGIAEVIVAKHRNGPVGRVRMAFRGQYTRFDNMARSMPSSGGPPPDSEPQGDF